MIDIPGGQVAGDATFVHVCFIHGRNVRTRVSWNRIGPAAPAKTIYNMQERQKYYIVLRIH